MWMCEKDGRVIRIFLSNLREVFQGRAVVSTDAVCLGKALLSCDCCKHQHIIAQQWNLTLTQNFDRLTDIDTENSEEKAKCNNI